MAQPVTSGQTHLDNALRLANAYNWADAGPEFVEAERLLEAEGDQRGAYYARLGRIRSTIDRGGALPEVIYQLGEELDSNPLLQSDLRLRLFCLIVKGDFDTEADHAAMKRDWEEARSVAEQLGDRQWTNRAGAQLGIAAYYDADLEGARQQAGQALMAAHAMGDRPGEMLILTILAHGLNYSKLYGQALPLVDQAIALAKATPETGYPHVAYQAKLTALIGMGDLAAAQRLAEEILAFSRTRNHAARESATLIQLGRIALAQGDQEIAISLLSQAIEIANAGGYLDTLAEAQGNLTEIYFNRRDLDQAEAMATEAVKSARLRGNFAVLPDRIALLGRLQVALGKYVEADQTFSQGSAFIDALVSRSKSSLDKTALISASSDLYRQQFGLVSTRFQSVSRAYSVIEQVRGRVLADLLASGSSTSPSAKEAARRASKLRLELMRARSAAEVKRISSQLFVLEQESWITPNVSIGRAARKPVPLSLVQKSLPPGTVILEYVLDNPQSYCLVITKSGARIVRLSSRDGIERDVAAYLKAAKTKQTPVDQAKALYRKLLNPIRETAINSNLVIVRDGELHLLPFDSLVTSAGMYVAETKVVSYANSASSFHLLRESRRRRLNSGAALLGVGGVPYEAASIRRALGTRGYDATALSKLPESKSEVLAAADAVSNPNSTLLIGPAATESAFKQKPLGKYRLLHMAVHALSNTSQPEAAALVMLSDPAAGEDGFLHASEVLHLRLNADLVVLSACETAIGPVAGEEGIATLSRAFLLAGARTVVSTLWSIEDRSSLMFMRQFYAHLAAHLPADQALAEAKRDVIRNYGRNAPPYYWAAFTLEGAGDSTAI